MSDVPASWQDFFSTHTVTGWDLALALVVLIASYVLARLSRRTVTRLLDHVEGVTPDVRSLVERVTFYFVFLVGVGVALSIFGVPVEPLLTAAVIVGVIAVLALRGVAENFAAGVVLQTRRPIQLGDTVESLGHRGV